MLALPIPLALSRQSMPGRILLVVCIALASTRMVRSLHHPTASLLAHFEVGPNKTELIDHRYRNTQADPNRPRH